MVIKKLLFFILINYITQISCQVHIENTDNIIYVYKDESQYKKNVTDAFDKLKIPYQTVDAIKDPNKLYILFDVYNWQEDSLPKYFIAYQTLDLENYLLSTEYGNKLSRAVAIWDYSHKNINQYRSRIFNYYYFPLNYEFIDPACLACKLPLEALTAYREILMYSNSKNTDISSHLPTLYCYAVMQRPNIIVESGVRGGESTIPLHKAQAYCSAKLIGLDVSQDCAQIYAKIPNSLFLCMDDLQFPNYCKNHWQNQKMDMIFIDTSHLYWHTLAEIKAFVPLLTKNGSLVFHDSNGPEHTWGVKKALKEYLSTEFDENKYIDLYQHSVDGIFWHMIHYPFCNGLTVLKKVDGN
jgi:hypothetical protein